MNDTIKNKLKDFCGLISEKDYLNIEKEQFHPLIDLFGDCCSSNNYEGYRYYNTRYAFGWVSRYDNKWLESNRKAIVSKDVSCSSAKLGELRCYGSLMEAFSPNNVKCVPETNKPTPDYVVSIGNTTISFEVNTLNMNGEEQNKMIHNIKNKIDEYSIAPYGRKNAETISENVIHKLVQVKDREHQLTNAKHHLLWIDIQNEEMNLLGDRASVVGPIFTGLGSNNGIAIYSNELWYSCYGRKGYPLFENTYLSDANGGLLMKHIPQMKHNGRFAYKHSSKYEMIIFSFPQALVIYENPFCCKLPKEFYKAIFSLRHFAFESSLISYPNSKMLLKCRIWMARRQIQKMSKGKFYLA